MEIPTLHFSSAIPSAVVVHAGSRDHYQVALALHEAGLLEKLVTDIYFPLDQPWFVQTVGRLLPKSLLAKRYCPGLPSNKVCSTVKALGVIIVQRLLRGRVNLHPISDAILGSRARVLAHRKGSAIFSYSTYASEAFRATTSETASKKHLKLLFQMHPHPASALRLIKEEVALVTDASDSLLNEHEISISPQVYQRLVMEPAMADVVFVASTFCGQTVTEHGIPTERLRLAPYGIDSTQYPDKRRIGTIGGPLKLVFVGSIIQRKGISYLLDTMKLLIDQPVRLVLCGRIAPDAALLEQFRDYGVEVKLELSHDHIIQELHAADIFVFPSILEGFAHVILEAMSCGLPVITTPNTCGPDIIVEGEHGFIVPIRDPNALADKVLWALTHREELAEMGRRAAIRAREFTWERFRSTVCQAYVSAAGEQPERI